VENLPAQQIGYSEKNATTCHNQVKEDDTSQTYLSFLMLHACLCTICFVFCYTSWHFYAFFGTNILTRCHSASSLFSAVFVFQKSYTANILGIGQKKAEVPIFPDTRRSPKQRRTGTRGQPHHRVVQATPGCTTRWCGPLVHPLTLPFHYIFSSTRKP
jgi:hypothetical protein